MLWSRKKQFFATDKKWHSYCQDWRWRRACLSWRSIGWAHRRLDTHGNVSRRTRKLRRRFQIHDGDRWKEIPVLAGRNVILFIQNALQAKSKHKSTKRENFQFGTILLSNNISAMPDWIWWTIVIAFSSHRAPNHAGLECFGEIFEFGYICQLYRSRSCVQRTSHSASYRVEQKACELNPRPMSVAADMRRNEERWCGESTAYLEQIVIGRSG